MRLRLFAQQQFFRYVVVGLLCVGIEYLSYLLLSVYGNVPYLYGHGIAVALATIVGYIFQKKYTFKNSDTNHKKRLWRFIVVICISTIIGAGVLYIFIDVLDVPSAVAKIIQLTGTVFLNYTAHKLYTFR